ncbi:MAG: hypothetical protein Q4A05_00660 [Ruminococcus sp.]|nr:hypothetical protein [Ruminococcus sp.]
MPRDSFVLDDPNIFHSLTPDYLIMYYIDHFDVQDITADTVYLVRECTDVTMTYNGTGEVYGSEPRIDIPEEAERTVFDDGPDRQLTLTVGNETGYILRAKMTEGPTYTEFTVEELILGEEAELPEDAAYIKARIAEPQPTIDTTFDLSALDE